MTGGFGCGKENVAYYEALASAYDLFFTDIDSASEAEVAWLRNLLRCGKYVTVLDAGCGNGRHAVRLAAERYDVVGADPSSAMLAQATANAHRFEVKLPLVRATFNELPAAIPHRFDVVLSFGNSVCNLGARGEIEQALVALYRCCEHPGMCIIGIKDFDRIKQDRPRFHGPRMVDRDGVRTILFQVWEYMDPVLVCTAYLLQGRVDSCDWHTASASTREYMLGNGEMRELAARAGFESVSRVDHPSEAVYILQA